VWMVTDTIGRDMWSRVVYGARISVTVGFATVALTTVFATIIGVSSAYLGGAYDIVVQRVVDAWMSFPALVIILSMLAALGPGLLNLILALSILGAAGTSRVILGAALSTMQSPSRATARARAVFGFNMFGDALRDLLDPRLRSGGGRPIG